MKTVETKNAPSAIGPYSQAIISGNYVFTSGQIPLDPASGNLIEGGIAEQTEQVIKNLSAVLEAADTGLENTVKTTCFLKNIADFAEFNAVYEKYFPNKPARSCIEVSALPKGALVEVEVVAAIICNQ